MVFRNDQDEAVFIKIYSAEDAYDQSAENLVGTMFVGPRSRASVSIRQGYYHLHLAEGETWYGEELLFGPSMTGLYCVDSVYHFENNYEHTLSLDADQKDYDSNSPLDGIFLDDF